MSLDLEHRAIDRTLADVEFLAQKRRFADAAQRFVAFRQQLEAHLAEEEASTFNAVPIVLQQHRHLEVVLQQLSLSLSKSDYGTFCAGLDELDRLLKEHHDTEERLLQPTPEAHPMQPDGA